ncbi:MAG TPA: GNAT family protein [Anaerolineae bacterium]|nr:GNAT family protein [Anaerolineae bacterium]
MKLHIRPMSGQDAWDSATWEYEPRYEIYNPRPGETAHLLDGANRYFCVHDEAGRLVGTCCFGAEARVAGGDYSRDEPEVLDVGVAMHPGLVGRGHGVDFVTAILEFAGEDYGPLRFRATIAVFNERSRRTFATLGFAETFRFERDSDGLVFIQAERDAAE